ncbi:MAG: helicase-related protein, partial [Aliidongia sp.]
VRRQRGGTAGVLGALSPRARNAQVAMYQAGEVDYMVATDAIGMGLNMDLDHVALARLSKFDGNAPRRLSVPEIAQIAGRAGRHMNDGSFGTTAEVGPLDPEMVEAIENHRFDPLAALWWRNAALDFRSAALLLRSLDAPPPLPIMLRVRNADDQQALAALVRQPEIARLASHKAAVRLLWEVCQIPDFRKVMSEQHARLLGQIYHYLMQPAGRLPNEWVAAQIGRLDRTEGEIDALVQRIAHIRTWTYITHRPGWLAESAHWQDRALGIEDKLSDALHDRLTQRFVDRRAASLVRHLAETRDLFAAVSGEGEVRVEGHFLGLMRGFRFIPDVTAAGESARALLAAANRILRTEVAARARRLAAEPDTAFALDAAGAIAWHGDIVARLAPGETMLGPRVEVLTADFLDGALRDQVRRRLEELVRAAIGRALKPLLTALAVPVAAAGRGLLFRLGETLGTLDAGQGAQLVVELDPEDRRRLTRAGVRFGTETIYVAGALKPACIAMRALLWSVHAGIGQPPAVPPPGRISMPAAGFGPDAYAQAIGYRITGPYAIRVDRLEPLAAALRKRARRAGGFTADPELAASIGVPAEDLPAILAALGYRGIVGDGVQHFVALPRRARRKTGHKSPPRPVAAGHPFARLKELEFDR